jgi:hypothetical protein
MRIDHLVWYNPDLDAGRKYFANHMDADPLYGGEHPGEGTANAVLALGPETYLEILGRDPVQNVDNLHSEVRALHGSGLYHWAVGGLDLKELSERSRLAGLSGGELVPGGRRKPDGTWLAWTCWGLHNHAHGALVPFFIDWGESDHPALSAPAAGKLIRLEVFSPQADDLKRIFEVLDISVAVRQDQQPRVTATLESGKGRVELQSFLPVPVGYVI